jgi:hypothetical protein
VAVVDSPVPELVAVDLSRSALSLYRRRPDDTWERLPGPATGFTPDRIVAGDLDGDGRTDLVVANNLFGLASLSVYRGEADGTFTRVLDLKVGTAVSDLELVDVNQDGRPDVLFTNADGGDVGILLNQSAPGGALTFGGETRLRAGDGVRGVELSEATDVANAAFAKYGILNAYPPLYFVISNEETDSVTAADFTGDGVPDLLVANHGPKTFGLLRGKANGSGAAAGSFADPQVFSSPQRPSVVRAGDFDGDGLPDLAVLNQDERTVTVLRGDGHGGFTPFFPTPLSAGSRPTGLSVVDVDRDGNLDLVVGNQFGDVLILRGDGQGRFEPPSFTGNRAPLDVRTLGPNGPSEVLVANQKQDSVLIRTAAPGSMQFTQAVPLADGTQKTVLAPGAVQWNRLEGNSGAFFDAVVMGSGSNNVLVYRTTGFDAAGQPTFAPPVSYPVGTHPVGVTIRDLNGDNIPDMLVANQGSNDVSVLFGSYDSEGHWVGAAGPRLRSGGQGPLGTTLRDVNGDGIPDLVVTDSQGGPGDPNGNLTVLPGRGQGFFDDRAPLTFPLAGSPTQAPSFAGSRGVVPAEDGGLIGIDLDNFRSNTLFTPPGGQRVMAAVARPDGSVFVAEEGGTVLFLTPRADSPVLTQSQPLTGFTTRVPSEPSALAVVETASGPPLVLVTNQGEDNVFAFAFGPAGSPPAGSGGEPAPVLPGPEQPGPTPEASAPVGAPLALVLTLVAGNLPAGEAAAAGGTEPTGGGVAPPGSGPVAATVVQPGGGDEGNAADGSRQDTPAPEGGDLTPGLDEALRQLDLYRRTKDPDADGPIARRTTPAPADPRDVALVAFWESVGAGMPPDRLAEPEAAALARALAVSGVTPSGRPTAERYVEVAREDGGELPGGPAGVTPEAAAPVRTATVPAPGVDEDGPLKDDPAPAVAVKRPGGRDQLLALLAAGGLALWLERSQPLRGALRQRGIGLWQRAGRRSER